MTSEEFKAAPGQLGISRRELCRRLEIARKSADAYALGRAPVPKVVALAIAALKHGLDEPENEKGAS